jgi:transglutaminase-like putative cysteine protease
MHFAIRYLTEYRYDGPVTDNLNALRVQPVTSATQRVDDFGVRVDPQTRLHQHLDYYGTTVTEFGISKAHEHLSIDVRARVATKAPPEPPAGSWATVEGGPYRAAAIEFLLPTPGEPDDLRIDEMVGLVRDDTPLGALERAVQVIPDRFEYRPGVTYVGSTIMDLLEAGAGVCQDFAHLALLLLRRNGIAARYVSGYLFAPPDGDEDADSAEGETHAWLEALVPAEDGEPLWVGVDPTNRCLSGERYVKIGHGRNYQDVPPVKGVYRGSAGAKLETSVRMHRTDTAGARA